MSPTWRRAAKTPRRRPERLPGVTPPHSHTRATGVRDRVADRPACGARHEVLRTRAGTAVDARAGRGLHLTRDGPCRSRARSTRARTHRRDRRRRRRLPHRVRAIGAVAALSRRGRGRRRGDPLARLTQSACGGSDSGQPGQRRVLRVQVGGHAERLVVDLGLAVLPGGGASGMSGSSRGDRRLAHDRRAYPQLRRRTPRVQDLRHRDAPVVALAVLQQRDQRAPDGDRRAVQRGHVARAAARAAGSGCSAGAPGSRSCSTSR